MTTTLLETGYRRCADLTRAYGTTYYWGALLLPKRQRRDVYAVYALCRLADDIVDEPEKVDLAVPSTGTEAERLDAFASCSSRPCGAGRATSRSWPRS